MIARLSRIWEQPSAVLPFVQLGSVLLFPFMEGTAVERAALYGSGRGHLTAAGSSVELSTRR